MTYKQISVGVRRVPWYQEPLVYVLTLFYVIRDRVEAAPKEPVLRFRICRDEAVYMASVERLSRSLDAFDKVA